MAEVAMLHNMYVDIYENCATPVEFQAFLHKPKCWLLPICFLSAHNLMFLLKKSDVSAVKNPKRLSNVIYPTAWFARFASLPVAAAKLLPAANNLSHDGQFDQKRVM